MAEQEPLGSAADEAARLMESAGQWLSQHLATGEGSCQVCPVCQLISRVRQQVGQPEVAEHLLAAGEALLAAARASLAASEREWSAQPEPPVQHIDIG
jgi:hypothetical protein